MKEEKYAPENGERGLKNLILRCPEKHETGLSPENGKNKE